MIIFNRRHPKTLQFDHISMMNWPLCLCCEPPLWSSHVVPGFYPFYRRSCSSSADGPRAAHSSLQTPQTWPCRVQLTTLYRAGWQRRRPRLSEDSLRARIWWKTMPRNHSISLSVLCFFKSQVNFLPQWFDVADLHWTASWTYRAETLVVKLAQSLAYISLVVPVMSSHWAGAVPPRNHTGWVRANWIIWP